MAALILAGRNIALIVALVLTAILGTAAARAYPTTDVFCFVTAARLVAEGKDPYETMVWTAATAGEFADYRGSLRPSSCLDHFAYPLSTAIALIPLSWIDPGWVPFVWQIVLFAASAVGVTALAGAVGRRDRTLTLALAVALSQPFWLTVLNAQFGGILLAAVGACMALAARHKDSFAGVALSLGWLKPHVVAVALVAAPIRRLRARQPAMALAMLVTLVLATAVSFAVRPGWAVEYATLLVEDREAQTAGSTSLVGISSALTSSAIPGILTAIAVVGLAVLLLWRHQVSDAEFVSLAVASSLVLSPHLGSHDQLLLAPSWAVLLQAQGSGGGITVALLAVVLPWALYSLRDSVVGPEGLSGLMPAITLLTVAFILRARSPARPNLNRYKTAPGRP